MGAVVGDNGVAYCRSRGGPALAVNECCDAVSGQNFEDCVERRGAQGVGVSAHKHRALDSGLPSILDDSLGNRRNVGVSKCPGEGASAVSTGSKDHPGARLPRVDNRVVIGGDDLIEDY